MIDLDVSIVDSVYVRVNCDRSVARELSDYFTFKVPGYKFMPAYRSRMWDGEIRLYNIHTQQIYAGLVDYIHKFAQERNYSITLPAVNGFKTDTEAVRGFIQDHLNVHVNGNKASVS